MPGDLSQGQFVIVCQPLYTVNTTNCRLIQMSTGAHARFQTASPFETQRVAKFRLVHVGLAIRLINLAELHLRSPPRSLDQIPGCLSPYWANVRVYQEILLHRLLKWKCSTFLATAQNCAVPGRPKDSDTTDLVKPGKLRELPRLLRLEYSDWSVRLCMRSVYQRI